MKNRALILSCEHGGARVPSRYRHLFGTAAARKALRSHRGSDLGAIQVARSLQRGLGAPLHASTVTRLLVDLNRSIGHPRLFSEFSKNLNREERATLLEQHYFPHRRAIESSIAGQARRGRQVVHVCVHSFASRIDEQVRTADLGLLYDPSRASERAFANDWRVALRSVHPGLRVRRNYPYLGTADGLATHLRSVFGPQQYIGIELELSQSILGKAESRRKTAKAITQSLQVAMG